MKQTSTSSRWHLAKRTFAAISHPDSCEDSALIARHSEGHTLLCVADGAGGCAQPEAASRRAVEISERLFHDGKPPPQGATSTVLSAWLIDYFENCGAEFDKFLTHNSSDPNDFSTTLAILVLVDDWILLASIGDSFAVVADEMLGPQLLHLPDRPTPKTTYMLTDWQAHARYKVCWRPSARGVMLSTDGLERLLKFKPVQVDGGKIVQYVWSIQKFIAEMLEDFIESHDSGSLDRLNSQDIRALKGDDIGVSMAARRRD